MKPPADHFLPSFLKNINTQLEQHLSDETLDVHKLTRLVGMSRTNLHRKLVLTVGMSATAYMRFVRLQHAAQLLLEHPDWCIYRVAMDVGFQNLSYFTRRFKALFGVSPRVWRARRAEKEISRRSFTFQQHNLTIHLDWQQP